MARLEYFIVCATTSIDVQTNSISLFNVLDDVFLDDNAGLLPSLEAVCLWHLDPEDEGVDYQAKLRITLPDGTGSDFRMNLARAPRRNRLRAIQGIRMIPLEGPGEIRLEILLNDQHEASHTISVHAARSIDSGEVMPYEERVVDQNA
jgi:hypothetical protein